MAPVDAGFVACGGDDSTGAVSTNEDGLAFEFGVVALFDGCEEGVHVDMEDGAERGRGHGRF